MIHGLHSISRCAEPSLHTNYYNRCKSPSPVFLILIQWLLPLVKQDGVYTALGATIAYDLDRFRVVQAPLSLPLPLDRMWKSITKIIDVFHFSNHIGADCRIKYSPEKVKELNPSWYTQAGDQTVVWLPCFKHVACPPMPKHHHAIHAFALILLSYINIHPFLHSYPLRVR